MKLLIKGDDMAKEQCFKCGKDMALISGGDDYRLTGVNVKVKLENPTPEKVDYNNRQLGKYSDGEGGCNVSICYECYVDGIFNLTQEL